MTVVGGQQTMMSSTSMSSRGGLCTMRAHKARLPAFTVKGAFDRYPVPPCLELQVTRRNTENHCESTVEKVKQITPNFD
jgi:hypothetical protein